MKPALLLCMLLVSSCAAVSTDGPARRDRQTLNLASRDDDRPFSHAVLAGDTLYVAGTLGLDPETGLPPEDVREEVRLLLDSFRAKLDLAGLTMNDLVSVQVFCPDLSLYGTFNEIYGTYFEVGDYPVRAFVGSGPLLFGTRFEMNGIAVRP